MEMGADEYLKHQALLEFHVQGQIELELRVHLLVQLTWSRYHSPKDVHQSLQPAKTNKL